MQAVRQSGSQADPYIVLYPYIRIGEEPIPDRPDRPDPSGILKINRVALRIFVWLGRK